MTEEQTPFEEGSDTIEDLPLDEPAEDEGDAGGPGGGPEVEPPEEES